MKKIKVLHIHTLPIISGSGINTFLSMKLIDKNKFLPELACAPNGRLQKLIEDNGFKFRPIKNFVWPISPVKDFLALIELISLLRKQRYQIVHTHNSKAGFLGRLAAKICRVPIVIHTIHGFAFHSYEKFWRRKLYIFLERLAAKWSDKLIAISGYLVNWATKEKVAAYNKIIKIYSGIDLDSFNLLDFDIEKKRKELGFTREDILIGEIAKLWRGKGQHLVLKALRGILTDFPNVKAIFIGEGYLESELKKLAQKLNIQDKVKFLGFREDIPHLTAILDIVVLPSYWEGMGRSVLEAMACAKPIVASAVGGILDLIDDNINGILIPPGDVQSLTKQLIRLLRSRNLREVLGRKARERLGENFSAKKMIRDIEQVYNTLIELKLD